MLESTLQYLCCPKCKSDLKAEIKTKLTLGSETEFHGGSLICTKCKKSFPIINGILILVDDVKDYFLSHVKGISKFTNPVQVPKSFRSEFDELLREIETEHIEEDLEAERVISLYFMNHFLRFQAHQDIWQNPKYGTTSPLIQDLIKKYWDHGPFEQIRKWIKSPAQNFVELGCGLGGLFNEISGQTQNYLGIDSSFLSIALGRHLLLGASYPNAIQIPEDLLFGSRQITYPSSKTNSKAKRDLIVADLENPPLKAGIWDIAATLNTIDMLHEPHKLPKIQKDLLKKGGYAIQSSPYIWHEKIAKKLRSKLPKTIKSSSQAVKSLYLKEGFEITSEIEHTPWLFFKHLRQLEVYSVHMLLAKKP